MPTDVTVANLNAATGTIKTKLPAVMDKMEMVMSSVKTTLDGATSAMANCSQRSRSFHHTKNTAVWLSDLLSSKQLSY